MDNGFPTLREHTLGGDMGTDESEPVILLKQGAEGILLGQHWVLIWWTIRKLGEGTPEEGPRLVGIVMGAGTLGVSGSSSLPNSVEAFQNCNDWDGHLGECLEVNRWFDELEESMVRWHKSSWEERCGTGMHSIIV